MSLQDEFSSDFDEISGEVGTSATFGSTSFTCTVGDIRRAENAMPGGYLGDFDLVIHAAVADLGETVPAIGDHLTVNSVEYQVMAVTRDPIDPVIRFDLDTIGK